MPKIVNHDQYRKELLEKSFDLFAEKGYSSITMREIAQGLGVSTGTLYHYFPSKQALFEQLIEWMSQEDILMATAELEGLQTLQEQIEAIGQLIAKEEDYAIKQTSIMVDFYQHHGPEELRHSQLARRLTDQYKQGIAEILGIDDPAIAQFILSFMDGSILQRLWGNEEVSITEQMSLLGKMLTTYLEHQEEQPHRSRSSAATKQGEKI